MGWGENGNRRWRRPTGPETDAQHAATPRRLTSTELLDGHVEVVIEHAGREYRLRLTQNGKLILTA